MQQSPIALPAAAWSDRRWLLLLVLVTALLRIVQIANTEVASRDSISFIRQAWRLEHEPLLETVRQGPHHPGYPLALSFVSRILRAFHSADLPLLMQRSAQIVSGLASVLLVVPMYYLGRELFNRQVGFWGSLLFQILPSTGRILPDGLSEPLFLVFAALSLFTAARGLHTGRLLWFTLAGLSTAIAYLIRTEGLLVVLVTLLVLLALQGSQTWRRSWWLTSRNGLGLAVSCGVIVVPFMLLIGGVSLKTSAKYMLDPSQWKLPPREQMSAHAVQQPLPLAVWNFGPEIKPEDRYPWAAWALVAALDTSFYHFLTLFYGLGLLFFWRRGNSVPGVWIIYISGYILLALLYRLAQSNGYLGDRHMSFHLVGGIFVAVAGFGVVCDWIGRRVGRSGAMISLGLLTVFIAGCLPRTLGRLHGNRAGLREAGVWLAQNTQPGDLVLDPLAWSSYHAGRVFVEGKTDLPRSATESCYVVLEHSDNPHPHLWYLIEPARRMAQQGTVAYRRTVKRGKKEVDIAIYKVPVAVAQK